MHYISHVSFLQSVGAAVRSQRERKGWSRRELAEASGVSERFLAQLDTRRFRTWTYDADARQVADAIEPARPPEAGPTTVGGTWIYGPSADHYRIHHRRSWQAGFAADLARDVLLIGSADALAGYRLRAAFPGSGVAVFVRQRQ